MRESRGFPLVLTAAAAREIRERYATTRVGQRALAETFGVSRQCISKIVLGRLWKSAGGPICDPCDPPSARRDAIGRYMLGRQR